MLICTPTSLHRNNKQSGAILISFVFLFSIIISGYLIHFFNQSSNQLDRQLRTYQELATAKSALLSWAVANTVSQTDANHRHNAIILGQLPYPDRVTQALNYDGYSNCPASNSPFNDPSDYAYLIGQLPVYGQRSPCVGKAVGLGLGFNENINQRLWYAVSRNVVHRYEYLSYNPDPTNPSNPDPNNPEEPLGNPPINPDIIDNPDYPWLKVFDKNGNLLSDHVAAIIIAPGNALGNQSRSNQANPANFLDSITINGQLFENFDYDSPDEDFIMGDPIDRVSSSDVSNNTPYMFNDQLIYITIQELINHIEKRVAAEASALLNEYNSKVGQFPNAADLSPASINNNQYHAGTNTAGLIPLDVTDTCSCTDHASCSCPFSVLESIDFYRTIGNWDPNKDIGSCQSKPANAPTTCHCNGPGSCSGNLQDPTSTFTCQANGSCSHNLTEDANNKFTFTLPMFLDFPSALQSCQIIGAEVKCNAGGTFDIGLNEPKWFKHHQWQNYFYYTTSPTKDIRVGNKVSLASVLIAMGKPIESDLKITQTRPSSLLTDYLDSIENTNGDTVFESDIKHNTSQYNDNIFIVSP